MIQSTNLDPDNKAMPWERAVEQLERLQPAGGSRGPTCWLATIHPDGRPHLAGVAGHWLGDILFFVSGPTTRKARNLATNPRCSFAISLPNLDLTLDGTAVRVTDPPTLVRIAAAYTERGWPVSVHDDLLAAPFQAPSAPAPPWHLHAFTPISAVGVATAAAGGATRWRFEPDTQLNQTRGPR